MAEKTITAKVKELQHFVGNKSGKKKKTRERERKGNEGGRVEGRGQTYTAHVGRFCTWTTVTISSSS